MMTCRLYGKEDTSHFFLPWVPLMSRVAFQEVVIATNNRVSEGTPRFTISEETRGNIILKEWEHNIAEGKQQAKKITNSLQEAFSSIDDDLLGIDNGGNAETLMQMNVVKIST
jgi:hypothetical protein